MTEILNILTIFAFLAVPMVIVTTHILETKMRKKNWEELKKQSAEVDKLLKDGEAIRKYGIKAFKKKRERGTNGGY